MAGRYPDRNIDLSYRAFLKGWRALYLVTVAVPGELPSNIASWTMQQRRWNKGYAQTAREILPRLLASRLPWQHKLDAVLLLGGCMAGPLMLLEGGLWALDWLSGTFRLATIGPLAVLGVLQGTTGMFTLTLMTPKSLASRRADIGWSGLGTACATSLLATAMQFQGALMTARDVVDGLLGRTSAFVRTPKLAGLDRQRSVDGGGSASGEVPPPAEFGSIPN